MAEPLVINREQLLEFYRHIKLKADTHFDSYVKPKWDAAWRLYEDKYDYGSYKPEPENVRLPIADNLVTRLASVFSRALINLEGEFFTVEQIPEILALAAKGSEEIVDYVFEDNDFPRQFNKSLQLAFITSPSIFKVIYEVDTVKIPTEDTQGNLNFEERLIGKIKVVVVSPWRVRLDPTEDFDNYFMEIIPVPLHEFKDLAAQNNWDIEQVNKAIEKKRSSVIDVNPDGTLNNEAFNPTIVLRSVFTKVAYNKEGEEIGRDIHFFVADDEFIVDIEKNKLPHGRFPYIVGMPLVGMGSKYGRGYLTKLSSLIRHYIESIDLLVSVFRLSTWGMWSYNPSDIARQGAHTFTSVVRPGQWYPYKNPDSIQNLYTNTAGAQIGLNIQQLFDFLLQVLSFQNEFVQGRPTTKGRPTAAEIRLKANQSQSFFQDIAIELEDTIIKPLIELILLTEFSFWNDKNHIDKENIVTTPSFLSALNSLTTIQRIELILNGQIRARGMSGRVRRATMFDKLALMFEIGAQYPPLLQQIKPQKIIEAFFESVGEAPSEWIRESEEVISPTPEQPGVETEITPEQQTILAQQIGGATNVQT